MDGFHTHGKQLYQVYERNYYAGKVDAGYPTQGLLAEELKKVIPEIQYASAMDNAAAPGAGSTIEVGNKVNKMTGSFAGADFFSMFSYRLLQGKPGTALNAPGVIAISRQMAVFFFGSPEQAIGKTLRFENKEDLQISAVFEDAPANSSLQFDFLRSWTDFVKQNDWVNNWGNSSPSTYLQLRAEVDPVKVEAKIKDFIYRYKPQNNAFRTEVALQSFPERYLHSTFKNGFIDGGRIEYVNLFTIVAVFILLIACINFMNLATAQAAKRAKEIGIRKVVGAARLSLIGQFIGEALLLTFLSLGIALLLSVLVLPAFNDLTGKHLSLPVTQPVFWITLVGLLIVTGLVAGSYPAFFLSSLDPIKVLKGSLKFSWRELLARRGLVVFQFSLTILLIIGMIVIYRQLDYIQTKNIGYDRENLVYLPIEGDLVKNYTLFKEEAGKLPGIVAISKMRNSPTVIMHHTGDIGWSGKDPNLTGKVIGVLSDFHFSSMHNAIDPLIIRLDENWSWGTILVRTRTGRIKETLAGLEKITKDLNPKSPFTYQFSDQEFAKLYQSEQLVSKLSSYFAFLGIFISCLGLFGLATFTAAQRTKEMGIRKVLGASAPGIALLLANDFLKTILLSMLLAFPAAWLIMNKWLENFAYNTGIDWWIFALAGMVTTGIALLTISYQSIASALANPIKSLRTE